MIDEALRTYLNTQYEPIALVTRQYSGLLNQYEKQGNNKKFVDLFKALN
jgi:hypothetical protein